MESPGGSKGLSFALELKKALRVSDVSCTLDGCSAAPWDQTGVGEHLISSWAILLNCWGAGDLLWGVRDGSKCGFLGGTAYTLHPDPEGWPSYGEQGQWGASVCLSHRGTL